MKPIWSIKAGVLPIDILLISMRCLTNRRVQSCLSTSSGSNTVFQFECYFPSHYERLHIFSSYIIIQWGTHSYQTGHMSLDESPLTVILYLGAYSYIILGICLLTNDFPMPSSWSKLFGCSPCSPCLNLTLCKHVYSVACRRGEGGGRVGWDMAVALDVEVRKSWLRWASKWKKKSFEK